MSVHVSRAVVVDVDALSAARRAFECPTSSFSIFRDARRVCSCVRRRVSSACSCGWEAIWVTWQEVEQRHGEIGQCIGVQGKNEVVRFLWRLCVGILLPTRKNYWLRRPCEPGSWSVGGGRRQSGRGPAGAAGLGPGPGPPRRPPAPPDRPSWRPQGSVRLIGRSSEPGSDWSGTLGHSTEAEEGGNNDRYHAIRMNSKDFFK